MKDKVLAVTSYVLKGHRHRPLALVQDQCVKRQKVTPAVLFVSAPFDVIVIVLPVFLFFRPSPDLVKVNALDGEV